MPHIYGIFIVQVKALKTLRSILHLLVAIQRSLGAILHIFMLILVMFFMAAYLSLIHI